MQNKITNALPNKRTMIRMAQKKLRVIHRDVISNGKIAPTVAYEVARTSSAVTGKPLYVLFVAKYDLETASSIAIPQPHYKDMGQVRTRISELKNEHNPPVK